MTHSMRLTHLYYFDSFDDLYKQLPLLSCGYTRYNVSTAKSSDMNKYYSVDK